MGWIYAGGKTNQKTNAYAKNGETNQKYLSSRVGAIRHKEGNFVVFKYLEVFDTDRATTQAIEGHMRYMMTREGWQNVQNDHFVWSTTPENKMADYRKFAERSMFYAKQYCDLIGVKYVEYDGDMTARRTCKHRK